MPEPRIFFDADRLERNISRAVGDQLREPVPARLAHPSTLVLDVPVGTNGADSPGYVWVYNIGIDSDADDEGDTIVNIGQALNSGPGKLARADLVPRRPVMLKPHRNGEWMIYGVDPSRDPEYTYGVDLREQVRVPLGQMDILLLKPTDQPSMRAVIGGGLVWFNDVPYFLGQQLTDDLTADAASVSDGMAMVRLYMVNPVTGAVTTSDSSEFSAALEFALAFLSFSVPDPDDDADKLVAGWIRLTNETTSLRPSNELIAGQEVISKGGSDANNPFANVMLNDDGQMMRDDSGNFMLTDGTVLVWDSGTGDVVGPASSTDNAIARFDGTTGDLLQNSVPTLDDTGNLNLQGQQLRNYAERTATVTPSTPYAIDWSAQSILEITLNQNTTFTFSNLAAGRSLTLVLIQDATGSRTATWPAAVKWGGGAAPTLSTGANEVDVVSLFIRADGSTVYGFLAGTDMS